MLTVKGGGKVALGNPPSAPELDWVVLVSGSGEATILNAINDFKTVITDDFVPSYIDKNQKALAINAARHQNKFAAAEHIYDGASGSFDLVLTTLTETDGESSYRLLINDKKIGEVTNPETKTDYGRVPHTFKGVTLNSGDTIRIEFNTASNGKIPEGDAFAFARGRWQSVAIQTPTSSKDEN